MILTLLAVIMPVLIVLAYSQRAADVVSYASVHQDEIVKKSTRRCNVCRSSVVRGQLTRWRSSSK